MSTGEQQYKQKFMDDLKQILDAIKRQKEMEDDYMTLDDLADDLECQALSLRDTADMLSQKARLLRRTSDTTKGRFAFMNILKKEREYEQDARYLEKIRGEKVTQAR